MKNFKSIALLTLFILSVSFSKATVYYVNIAQPNNSGNGLSWANAKKDIQDAINLAVAGDSVWVAAGTYLPTDYPPTTTSPLSVRSVTIFIPDGIKLYGGFNGSETQFSQRDVAVNISTLSGDLAANDVVTGSGSTLVIANNAENAYHVLVAVTPVTGAIGVTVDGFSILGGHANVNSSISINGFNIFSNTGAGMHFTNGGNVIVNNIINFNKANDYAGINVNGIHNVISNNTVRRNEGTYSVNTVGQTNIIGNLFTSNKSNAFLGNTDSIYSNTISDNYGDGINGSGNYINQNTISNNAGIGIDNTGNSIISYNSITGNSSGSSGGGIRSSGAGNIITNNFINGNTGSYGGGISASGSTTTISYNVISGNNASGGSGGGIYGTNISLNGNSIFGNTAVNGAGIYFTGGTNNITNTVIAQNSTTTSTGGGIYFTSGTALTINNSTIYKNTASIGSGIYGTSSSSTLNVNNTIFWGNSNDDFRANSSNTFKNCLLQFALNHYTFAGTGIYDLGIFAANNIFASSPKFVDSTNVAGPDGLYRTADDGLRLKPISPCLNTGISGAGIPTTDILGVTRPQGAGIDMGAYERLYCTPVVVPLNTTPVANQNICNGFSTILSVSSAEPSDSIFWYTDSTTSISLATGYSFTTSILSGTDTFWVNAHNCDSGSVRLPVVVNVSPVISISATPNDTVCEGTPVLLTASGASSYSWTGGITNGTAFTPVTSGTYTVTATDINGCTKTAMQSITLNALPPVTVSATPNDTVCVGTAVTLSATGASLYSWSGGITNGLPFTPTASSTSYTVTATGGNGCTKTVTQLVVVNSLPTINISATPNDTICQGSPVNVTANGASTYSWSGGITNGVSFTPTASGTYTVTATDINNCSNTSTQLITLNSLPPLGISVTPNDTICSGEAITITANGASTYSWSGGITNGVSFTPTGSGTYTVTATGSNGCTKSDLQSIVVKPNIIPTISVSSAPAQGATGDAIVYTAVTNVPLPYAIDWYRNTSFATTTPNNTWNTTIIVGNNSIYAVIKSVDNCLTPDSAKSNTLSILNVTGISDIAPPGFSIYPNPTNSQLTLTGLTNKDKFKIYNTLGQLVLTENRIETNIKVLSVGSFADGMYTIVFERNEKKWVAWFEKR